MIQNLGYKCLEDLYKLLPEDFTRYGGKALFEKIFGGHAEIKDMPMFAGINKFPEKFLGPPKIVKSPNILIRRDSTTGYTLYKFFNEKPELRPTFYFPDFYCGPDLIFFVEFNNQIKVPVFVQFKLRYTLSVTVNVIKELHPTRFYKRKMEQLLKLDIMNSKLKK